MSVQTEIDRISAAVQNAHLKVIEKGGTTAAPYLVGNLASAIDTIPEATAPTLQSKTVSPSTSAQTVKPDSGYDGLSQVTVNAMTTATQATPSISVDSAGKITASATQTAGYVAAGTKSATKQLTTQAAKTVTPSTSSQTAVASGVYTTGAVTVAAIPSSYVKPSATKAATTYTPTTSNQTIAAGTYCSGAQTIKGDANLVAGNIKSGVSIFGVAGSYVGSDGGSTGGGGGELSKTSGTIKPSSGAKTYTLEHGLGKVPLFVYIASGNLNRSTASIRTLATAEQTIAAIVYFNGYMYCAVGSYSGSSYAALVRVECTNVNETTITFDVSSVSSDNMKFATWYTWEAYA